MKIIDIHTHAFPDNIAERALQVLEEEALNVNPEFVHTYNLKTHHNGTVKGLLKSMDNAGIDISVVNSIATKPKQVYTILEWSKQIMSERIIPFISLHPDFDDFKKVLKSAKDSGIKGIKLHPQYQRFRTDDEKLFPMYEEIAKLGMILLFHSGADMAFPGNDDANPKKTRKIISEFKGDLKLILAHMGAFQQWDDFKEYVLGEEVYIDTSFGLGYMTEKEFYEIIDNHKQEKILFGTDSPWMNQKSEVEVIKKYITDEKLLNMIFYENAEKLLGL